LTLKSHSTVVIVVTVDMRMATVVRV